MSITATTAITQALNVLGRLFPGETPSTSEQNDALLIVNQMLANWYNEQLLALSVLLSEQNNAGLELIAKQGMETAPLVASYVLASATYTAPSYTAGSVAGGTIPQFADLSTPLTLPTGYDLAVVLGLAVELAPVYGVAASNDLIQDFTMARAAANPVPGRIPIPGTGFQGTIPPPGQPPGQGGA